jgi:hypothetical protein
MDKRYIYALSHHNQQSRTGKKFYALLVLHDAIRSQRKANVSIIIIILSHCSAHRTDA